VYVGFDGGGVVALLTSASVRLPLGMVLSGTLPAIAADPAVVVGAGALSVDDHVFVAGRWFDPRPRGVTTVRPEPLRIASRSLSALSAQEVGVDARRARRAVAALLIGDGHAACALLGDGLGLTPAGDDVLAGALAACALFAGDAHGGRQRGGWARGGWARAIPEILARAHDATTSLSAALLACAAAGQVVPEAARFLAALCGKGDVSSALAGLRSVGTSSGTALAVGVVAALDRPVV
jgi:hypothetical protein